MWQGTWNHHRVQFNLVGNSGNGDCLFDSINNAKPISRRVIHNDGDDTDVVFDQLVTTSRVSLTRWLSSQYEEYLIALKDNSELIPLPSNSSMYALSMEMLNILELYWLSPYDLERDIENGVRQEARWASNVLKQNDFQILFKLLFQHIPSDDGNYLEHMNALLDDAGFENSDYKNTAVALWNEFTIEASIELFKLLVNDPGRLDQREVSYVISYHDKNIKNRSEVLEALRRKLLSSSVVYPFLEVLGGIKDDYKYYPSQYITQAIAIQLGIRIVIWSPEARTRSLLSSSQRGSTSHEIIPKVIFKYDFHDHLRNNYYPHQYYGNDEGDSLVSLEHFPVVHLFLTGDHFQTLIPTSAAERRIMSNRYSLGDIASLYKSPRSRSSSSRGTRRSTSRSSGTRALVGLDTRQMSLKNDPIPLITIEHPERPPSARQSLEGGRFIASKRSGQRGRFSHYRSRARSAVRRHEGKLALTGAALLGGAAYAQGGGIAGPIAAGALGLGTYAVYKAYTLAQIVKNFFHTGLTKADIQETRRITNLIA